MIPSNKWFPTRLQERAAWFDNFVDVLTPIVATLGFTPAEMTAITEDNQDFQSIAATMVELDNFSSAVRQFRISLTEDPIGTPQPFFPSESFGPPPNGVPAGMFQRLVESVDRIRAAPAFNDEMGAALGILPSKPGPVPEGELKPVIKVDADVIGYKFTANVTRLGQPAYKLQIQRQGSDVWTDAVVSTSNPTEYTVKPTTEGQSERILVRAILYKGTQAVGQPSDPTYVTVNP